MNFKKNVNHSKRTFTLDESEHFLCSLPLFCINITLNPSKSDVEFHTCKCTLTPFCYLFSGSGRGGGGGDFVTFFTNISGLYLV